MGLSRRQYAASRKGRGLSGGSESAVRKAISTGRISVLSDGTIDPARADLEWEAGTDSAKQRDPDLISEGIDRARDEEENGPRRQVPEAAVEAVQDAVADAIELIGEGKDVTYASARAAEMAIRAQLRKLHLDRAKGEIVDRGPAEAHVYDLARKVRDHWLQLPARQAASMAAELGCDAHQMEILLDRVIRQHLLLLSEVKVEFAAQL